MRRPDGLTIFFFLAGSAAALTVWQRQGLKGVVSALQEGTGLIMLVIPLVVVAILMASYAQALLPRRTIEHWLGRDAGWRGMLIATGAGILTPGGPFMAFPLVVGLRAVGASLPICVTYLTAWAVLGIQRVVV